MTKYRSRAYLLATILFIGDSHTYQSFGRNLDGLLRTIPKAQVATFAAWGTEPGAWFSPSKVGVRYFEHLPDGDAKELESAPTPLFPEKLNQYHPTLTIIALGANLYNARLDYSAAVVHQMAEATSNAHSLCIWVGPPDSYARSGPAMDELYGVLRGAASPYCEFVDSRQWTHYPAEAGDGLHYDYLGDDGIKQTCDWSQKVFDLVASRY